MTGLFGDVARLYDEARPSYPAAIGDAVEAYAGKIGTAVELGAGTGKATEIFARLAGRLTAIEPDPRMAAVLKAKFPGVDVIEATFEGWAPGGEVDLVGCAMAWHWMNPGTRNQLVHRALKPGGTLAIINLEHGHHDPAQAQAIDEFLTEIDPTPPRATGERTLADLAGAGLWQDIREQGWHELRELRKDQFLDLHRTFSRYLRETPDRQRLVVDGLSALLDDFGGSIMMDLHTTLVLARSDATPHSAGARDQAPFRPF